MLAFVRKNALWLLGGGIIAWRLFGGRARASLERAADTVARSSGAPARSETPETGSPNPKPDPTRETAPSMRGSRDLVDMKFSIDEAEGTMVREQGKVPAGKPGG